ncbi:MAG TPA: hypothetical protein VE965_02075 [Gammaproteobacteria bacterium]|jgi:hypothetical protein|nr:hypothetical protein [Gammaproteobacteria bacterium]
MACLRGSWSAFEYLAQTSKAMIRVAMIRPMVRRLARLVYV